MITYISIGNSDDKLTQEQWSEFYKGVDLEIHLLLDMLETIETPGAIHGIWLSDPASPYQNACWCVEFPVCKWVQELKEILTGLAGVYSQDSIAWHDVPDPEFLKPETSNKEEV